MPARFLVFVDKMFAASESFIPRSYSAFRDLTPVYIGHQLREAPPSGVSAIQLGRFHDGLGEAGFKQFGLVSDRLKARLAEERPTLIHAHFGKGAAYALPLARALGLPLVVTYHGGDATKIANTRDSVLRIYNRRRTQIWNEAALILPVSAFIRDQLAGRGCPPDRMKVLHNGVDAGKFAPGAKQKLILFAGRWVEKKGIDTLIAAFENLKADFGDWRIRLIGDGELRPRLVAQLKAAGVAAELPGWVNPDDMPAQFAEAMIVCVPSRRAATGDAEGLPMVCLEAMASGCAVAATRHAGIPECITDSVNGWLVPEGDHTALADRLRAMMADPAGVARMGAAGRDRALVDFNLDTQSARLEKLLLDVAGLSRGA